ncbi:uncharacterized protein LOC143189946 [Rhynchophorus ferrugineus]
MANVVFSIIWLLILIFLSFFIAYICATLYIIVYCLSACIPPLTGLADVLLSGVQFPQYCAKKMLSGEPIP